ncbi:Dehydrogenase/reductase SDR family member 11 [Camponotus floridanus]|uniref:Dehydrogenase/reductase SDR family member 11 n=2 Tax=Camponotus floridanus TaxID=104421 RepID=E2A6D7_CAMFO|nr:Dehydrogenase/reductase SDR family member 11 [Camponotus floridanus]
MSRWANKTAIVIGAGSDLGQAITFALLKNGIHVYYAIVSKEEQEKIKAEYEKMDKKDTLTGKLLEPKHDDLNIKDIEEIFEMDVNILINNIDADVDFHFSIHLKFMNEVINSMRRRQVEGHIFNINSIHGHFLPTLPNSYLNERDVFLFNEWVVSKHTSVTLTHMIRRQVVDVKPPIRVTSISPSCLKMNITDITLNESNNELSLMPEDVADAIIYALRLKPTVQITELIIQSAGMHP